MKKVLLILSDNNKGKFISKGFASAFKELSFFVFEKKIYDLILLEALKISPDIIFIFWTDLTQKEILEKFISEYNNKNTIFMHCAEFLSDIPDFILNSKYHYIFTEESKTKKRKYKTSIYSKDYKTKFTGYKYNITFAGNPAYKKREIILSKLIYNFGSISLFCRSFDFYKSVDNIYKNKILDDYFLDLYKKSYKGYVNSIKELADIYISSKINIDMENKKNSNINYRCMEITAAGGFLLAPYNKKIIKSFEDGHEFETYKNDNELTDKIRFYLNNLNLAQLIAEKGKVNTVSNHSVYDRLKIMLRTIYGKDTCN